jgi:predicted SprT family Zn-dependent metalloprotease
LAGAKPPYIYGTAQFLPDFANDIDKALYITSQAKPSKADEKYREFLRQHGFDNDSISYFGTKIQDFIKQKAAAAVQTEGLDTGGPLPIDFMRTKFPKSYSGFLSYAGLFSSPAAPTPAPLAPLSFPKVAPPTPLVPVTPGLTPEAATVTIEEPAQKLFDTWVPGFEGVLRTLVQGLFPGVQVEIGTRSGDFYGQTLPAGLKGFRIELNPKAFEKNVPDPELRKARLLKTIFHELSHNIEYTWVREADEKTFDAIMNQYVRQRNPNAAERYYLTKAFRDPDLLKDPASRAKILASVGMTEAQYQTFAKSKTKRLPDTGVGTVSGSEVGSQYQRSFTEWVAEQGARWITKELKNLVPKTTFEKFQKSVFDRLRQLYVDVAKALGIKFKDGAFENMMRDIYGNRITTPIFDGDIPPTFRPSAKVIIPYKHTKGPYMGPEEQILGPAVSLSENSIIGRDTEAESLAKKTPQERAVLERIAAQPTKMADHDSIIQREDRSLMGWFNQMMRSFSGALPGETLGKALLRNSVLSNLPFLERADTRNLGKFLESHQNATGRVMGVVNIGPLGYNPETKTFFYHNTATDKSLLKIFEKIGVARMDQAQAVFLAQREMALRAAGSGGILFDKYGKAVTYDRLRQIVASADKDILEASQEFQKFNDKMVEMAIQSGLIPRSLGERFKTLMYTPMFRYQEEELQKNPNITLGGDIYNAIQSPDNVTAFNQKLSVGGVVYADLYENILRNYNAIVSAAVRNVAYNETASVLTKLVNAGGDTTIAQMLDKPADGTITFRVNGEDRHMVINDPAMFSAVAALSPQDKNAFIRAASKFTGILRTGVTATPPFQLRNTIRGLVELKIKTGMPVFEILRGFMGGVKDTWSKGDAYQSIVAQTGFGGFGFGSGSKDQAAFMKRVYTSREKPLNAWNGFLRAFDKLEGLGEITEMAPRIAYYNYLTGRKMSDADAAWEAVNLVNYHRHGAGNGVLGSAVSNLIPLIPFLTARIQGLYRLTETGTAGAPTSLIGKGVIGIPAAIVTRGLMVTVINAAVNTMYGDEDWYKKLSVKDRLANMYVKVGDTVIALPRAYEVGELFGGLPTLLFDSIRKESGNDIAMGAGELVKKTFLVEPIPQIAKPIVELVANKNFYTGQAIETLSDKNRPKDLRFDEYTSNIAKFAGQLAPLTGLSPKQVDTLIRGYLGTSATLFLGTVDSLTSTGGTRPQGVFGDPTSFTGAVGNITGLSSILKTQSQLNNKFVGDFYELKQKVTEVVTAMNEAARIGDAAAVKERMEQMPQARGLYTAFNSANARLSEINRQMDTVRRSPQFTPERKTELLEKLRDAKGKLSQQMVEAAEKVGLTR